MKRRGPKVDPYGAPISVFKTLETELTIETYCFLFDKNDGNKCAYNNRK